VAFFAQKNRGEIFMGYPAKIKYAEQIESLIKELRKHLRTLGRSIIAERGMAIAHFYTLRLLSKNNFINMAALKKELGTTGAFATAIVDELVERSLVKRERDKDDRRMINLYLTNKGIDFLNKVKRRERKMLAFFAKTLNVAKAKIVKRGLSILIVSLKDMTKRFDA
jgi:DNA-binding MarR family transcriptional regulator